MSKIYNIDMYMFLSEKDRYFMKFLKKVEIKYKEIKIF
jgi:hypothetical protein